MVQPCSPSRLELKKVRGLEPNAAATEPLVAPSEPPPARGPACVHYRQNRVGFERPAEQPQPTPEPACVRHRQTAEGFVPVTVAPDAAKAEGGGRAGVQHMHRQTAPDGSVFETEAACQEYTYKMFHRFAEKSGERLVRGPGELKGQPFDLTKLQDCEVLLLDVVGQVLVDNLERCKVFIGACSHDVFLRNCTGCTFTVATRQLRTRDCRDCTINLYSMTRPVVETSSGLKFRRFNGAYARLGAHFKRAGLDLATNKWGTIHDFSKADDSLPQPHFVVEDKHTEEDWAVEHPAMKGKPVNPVPRNSSRIGFVNSGMVSGAASVLMPKGKKKKGQASKGHLGMGRSNSFNFSV